MSRRIAVFIGCVLIFMAVSLAAMPSFREICRDLAQKNEKSSVIRGKDGWLFLKEELQHVGAGKFWGEDAGKASRTANKKFADPLEPIFTYQKLLAEKGITLYLMPVPPKVLIYPDKLVEGVTRQAAEQDQKLYSEFYAILRKGGVQVIDLMPTLLEKRDEMNVYCKTDTHFSGEGLALFADAATDVIKQEKWYQGVVKKEFKHSSQEVGIVGDLSGMIGDTTVEEKLNLSVIKESKSGKLVASDNKSPVILLGDSHTLVFSAGGDLHAKGAGLFDQLSAKLGFAVDLLGVRGSGVTPARIKLFQRSKKDGGYLEGKKVLIWCFTARDFTGTGGWKKIPVAPK